MTQSASSFRQTLAVLATSFILVALPSNAPARAVQVFILAGQSNMEGQAVVALSGKDYNGGKGTLAALLANPRTTAAVQHLLTPEGKGRPRADVWVRYQREDRPLLAGVLDFGFSVYGDPQHFGPELQFGHVMGDALDDPVLLIKTAWGGKSLHGDFRPPSSGGETGKYYKLMIAQVREALAAVPADFPALKDHQPVLAGLVWYQGWNDGVNPQTAIPQYETNLANLIRDVRRDLGAPKLPVVVGELTGAWVDAPPEWERLRAAQAAAALRPEFAGSAAFAPTRHFVREAGESPNPSHGHHEFGNAETYVLVGQSLAEAMLTLLPPKRSAALQIESPVDFQVIQRRSKDSGIIRLSGQTTAKSLEARLWRDVAPSLTTAAKTPGWQKLTARITGGTFEADLTAPAGGWHRLEVRALADGKVIAQSAVEHVGIGEVFVVAGQSNSANYGEEKQVTTTQRVSTFEGKRWRLAVDPQPGAGGQAGSFMPPLGDELVKQLGVPVGFAACGIGATSVREWLPKGVAFPNPPTIESRVVKLPDGSWASNGAAYDAFIARMRPLGPDGFRAVLWHQGESDANQKDTTRTLPGKLYREHLEKIIRDSRRDSGFDSPWFVAQASYHVPGDEGSEDIRAAQASLWKDGIARPGPDSDALKGQLRERQGLGVHFSGPGLREHGRKWAEKIVPWLNEQLSGTHRDSPGLPKGHDYFELRDGISNAHRRFEQEKTGRIAFLGGSITAGGGWRDHTMKYFQKKFPQTKFEFIAAGIGSMGSVPHAFRLERDVLSKGPVDLLFVEAAVNDSSNIPDHPAQMLRGMEGVVRHAREVNPLTDIIHMHFVMPPHMDDYRKGRVPSSIAQHEKVAVAYGNPSLNLALEVTERIDAAEFTWDGDFKGLHPSPFGHQLYADSIARMLDAAFARPLAAAARPHSLPAPVDALSYSRGRFGDIAGVKILEGFTLEQAWKPADKKGTRAGFVDVPALVGTEPGAEFEFSFEGTGCGLFIAAGPDAGHIEFSVDGGGYRQSDTFTHWSAGLHLPWAVILDDSLKNGRHTARVRIAEGHNAKSAGTALRVFHLLLN